MSPDAIATYGRGDYLLSTDPRRLDVDAVYHFLRTAYWGRNKSRETVEISLRHSLCFGLYHGEAQIGLTRVVSDYATFAYLADVYVLEAHRGRGLGQWMIGCVVNHPPLQGVRQWLLFTADAHGLYARHGFGPPAEPDRIMVRRLPPTAPEKPGADG